MKTFIESINWLVISRSVWQNVIIPHVDSYFAKRIPKAVEAGAPGG